MNGYAWFVPLSLWSNPIRGVSALLGRGKRFRHRLQRPVIYFPHLKSTPWWPTDDITTVIEGGFDTFQSEFHAAEQHIEKHPLAGMTRSGAWRSVLLYRDKKRLDQNCKAFPQTLNIVEQLPICPGAVGQVYFSIMTVGTYLPIHCGITNTRLRYHLGIETNPDAKITVAGETRHWETGKCITFDDSFEHEVRNDGSPRRVVLIVDCWHPDLTNTEREFVTELMDRLNIPGVFRNRSSS